LRLYYIYAHGANEVFKINYQNASNSALKMLAPYFMDIHSQFETQKLFNEKNHIEILDEYASSELNLISMIIINYTVNIKA
ncbi:MAG: hypothetical protein LUF02_10465, partial [Erysipelotrichaceae bacterium]|nr:hypothetical protein [Erysipelotrichaceae bacterium]